MRIAVLGQEDKLASVAKRFRLQPSCFEAEQSETDCSRPSSPPARNAP